MHLQLISSLIYYLYYMYVYKLDEFLKVKIFLVYDHFYTIQLPIGMLHIEFLN